MKGIFLFLVVLHFAQGVAAQVNVQSGSATFSLPLFSWQDDKSRLHSSIALDYNSGSGLKVNDLASNAGQGWNLAAGGIVARVQAGEPDDQIPIDGAVEDTRKFPAGFLYDPLNAGLGCPAALASYPLFEDKNHVYKQHNPVAADKELDHFVFNINGRTGIFILDKESMQNPIGTGVTLGHSRLKISFIHNDVPYASRQIDNGVRTSITEFHIQDENGLIYKFSTVEKTKVLRTGYSNAKLQEEQKQPNFKHGNVYHEAAFDKHDLYNPYVINSWYLTEIEDALTSRKILFRYDETRNINSSAGTSLSYFAGKDYSMISHKTSVTITPALTSILYPDGHTVTMHYGANRVDLTGDKALASVDITYGGRYLSRYQLTTSYFILNRYGTPVTPYQKEVARLCLLSVQKYGVDLKAAEPPYTFDYYMGSSKPDDFVPPPFYHIKDTWGYYNGDYSHDYDNDRPFPLAIPIAGLSNNRLKGLCFLRKNGPALQYFNAKPGYAKNGLLKRISYPTGGTLDYVYAQNQALFNNQNKDAAGVHVSQTKLTDGGYSNDCDHPVVTNYTYRASLTDNSTSLWGVEMPISWKTIKSSYSPRDQYFYFRFPFSLGCDYRYLYPGIQSLEQSVSLNTTQKVLVTFSKVMEVVGVIMDVVHIVNLCSGPTPAAIAAVIIDYIATLATIAISCLPNLDRNETQALYYNADLNSVNPLPAQFKRVEVTESAGENGRTVLEFTSMDDYAIWEPDNRELSLKQRFAHWAYGLPTKTTVYDSADNIVRQTENVYDWKLAKRMFFFKGDFKYFSCKCVINKTSSMKSTEWADPAYYTDQSRYVDNQDDDNADLQAFITSHFTGRVELQDSYERVYKPGGTQYLETVTHYGYNSENYQVNNISVVQSNGDEIVKHITYSSDYRYDLHVLHDLNTSNIVSLPVSTTEGIIKHSTNSPFQYLGEKVTEFIRLPNGDIRPLRTLEQRLAQPGAVFEYTGPDDPANAGKYKEVQRFSYDLSGNMVGLKDEGNHTVSNIYDYNDKYVVASVINADPVLDKPAYTSFETNAMGGWTSSGLDVTGSCVTGTRYFLLSNKSISASIANIKKPYVVSFWATNNTVKVNGSAAPAKSGPTIGGYTYYEYMIAQGVSTVTLSGNAAIDELRLYPQTARMRTVSYDPLIGKIAECDENNRISYFEYDELGRLRFLKDESRNIIKMYEYNYASTRSGNCRTIYQNYTIRELITPDNCPAGYTSEPVPVTVEEGAFSSIISQADADKKAEDYLLANGQRLANADGICMRVYFNDALSQKFTKQGCAIGKAGTTITYSVPAGKYTSTISLADANQQAQDEIDANGQAFVNKPGMGSCVISTEPVWQGTGLPQVKCQTDANGRLTGHQLVLVTDVNPNSNSNPRTQWKDIGINPSACPVPTPLYGRLRYENVYNTPYGTVADVVVQFYLDRDFTQPVVVNNLSLNYYDFASCDNGGPVSSNSVTTVVSGSSIVLLKGVAINYMDTWNDQNGIPHISYCTRGFMLLPSSEYNVIP